MAAVNYNKPLTNPSQYVSGQDSIQHPKLLGEHRLCGEPFRAFTAV